MQAYLGLHNNYSLSHSFNHNRTIELITSYNPFGRLSNISHSVDAYIRSFGSNQQYGNSTDIILRKFGKLPASSHPDLRLRSSSEVRRKYKRIFKEIPRKGFDPRYKNPCWVTEDNSLECLPYAYILGQPKCGSSDLFNRITKHQSVAMPSRKEIRWFTRGEFTTTRLADSEKITSDTSITSYTGAFLSATKKIRDYPSQMITIDGGPHIFWWPTQQPDGSVDLSDVPPPQLLRELQPSARFIITISDPVRRMYSDYYFLGDDLKPNRNDKFVKSPEQFHKRSMEEIVRFQHCLVDEIAKTSPQPGSHDLGIWFRASQACAHDRHKFARGGWGRLSIGLYVLYLEKWLEHFSPQQFLVLRLEDYEADPKAYMKRVYDFLDVGEPLNWDNVINDRIRNKHRGERPSMLNTTEALLRAFFQPYNMLLANYMNDMSYLWESASHEEYKLSLSVLEDYVFKHTNSTSAGSSYPADDTPTREIDDDKEVIKMLNTHEKKEEMRDTISHAAMLDDDKRPAKLRPANRLRGSSAVRFKARSFSLDGLPRASSNRFNEFVSRVITPDTMNEHDKAVFNLCIASFGLDLAALEHLLYKVGVPVNAQNLDDRDNTALHCLAAVATMGDAHSKSYVFSMLKGQTTWLTSYLDPPLPLKVDSVITKDILNSLASAINSTAQWLLRAGGDPNAVDSDGHTPLHIAASGGLTGLVAILLEHGADPNIAGHDMRTPMHGAVSHGHSVIGQLLLRYGANMDLEDIYGVTPRQMVEQPGPILPEDALKYFDILQRSSRSINRVLQPELHAQWNSTGGWSPDRLLNYETDMECAVDEYEAGEISGTEIFEKYIARNSPILIRGLLSHWKAIDAFSRDALLSSHGGDHFTVSSIPYAEKFGGVGRTDMTLREYMDGIQEHNMTGGKYPWYIFKGHPLKQAGPMVAENSLVYYDICPTPYSLTVAFQSLSSGLNYVKGGDYSVSEKDARMRKSFVNAQWAVGGPGTGAPVHFHNTAW